MNVIAYEYVKIRKNFGRQPLFCEVMPHLLDSIPPDPKVQAEYILRNPVNREVQVGPNFSHREINTINVNTREIGLTHQEGGWPKEINYLDEDATARHRRRIEKDDGYIKAVMNTYPKLEYLVKQNNSVELYEMYFTDLPPKKPKQKYHIQTKNTYKDAEQNCVRPVSCIDWTRDENAKLVITYCDRTFPTSGKSANTYLSGYIWDAASSNEPVGTLDPPSACWEVACSPISATIIIGGLEDGRVCVFDIRAQSKPTTISPWHLAHRDPVTALIYIESRRNYEFMSGSPDGQCLFWDLRNLSSPMDTVVISPSAELAFPQDLSNAEPVRCLQFDKKSPSRFLCGTDKGQIISVNRKGKNVREKFPQIFNAHYGPVKALHRSQLTNKMLLTCGDWSVNIWNEDNMSAPIISGTKQMYTINDVCWASGKVSAYMSIASDGLFRFWDISRIYSKPTCSHPVSDVALLKMKVHTREGRYIAVGDQIGRTYFISLSDSMVKCSGKDKHSMMQTFERESRRERILDGRLKEIILKLREKSEVVAITTQSKSVVEVVEDETYFKNLTEEYFKVVTKEIDDIGLPKPLTRGTGVDMNTKSRSQSVSK